MPEEQKAAQEAQEVETSTDDETTEEKSKEESQQVDYKAELDKERQARELAEKSAADLAFKLREKKRNEEDYDEEEKPLTAKELQKILAEERQANEKKALMFEAERIADTFSTNSEEKSLILEIHKNRSFPSHLTLSEQIEESYLIANKKRILGENSELKRALKSKQNVNNTSANTHQDEPSAGQPKMSPADAKALDLAGFKWNGTKRVYEKKLADGRTLIRDPKTKNTYLS